MDLSCMQGFVAKGQASSCRSTPPKCSSSAVLLQALGVRLSNSKTYINVYIILPGFIWCSFCSIERNVFPRFFTSIVNLIMKNVDKALKEAIRLFTHFWVNSRLEKELFRVDLSFRLPLFSKQVHYIWMRTVKKIKDGGEANHCFWRRNVTKSSRRTGLIIHLKVFVNHGASLQLPCLKPRFSHKCTQTFEYNDRYLEWGTNNCKWTKQHAEFRIDQNWCFLILFRLNLVLMLGKWLESTEFLCVQAYVLSISLFYNIFCIRVRVRSRFAISYY